MSIAGRGNEVDLNALVDGVNDRHGTSWTIVGRLPGGFQRGAHELRDRDGERAVLKWHPRDAASDVVRVGAVLDRARAAGWANPRWLACGAIADGTEYVVEELVDRAREAMPTESDLALVLALNRRQADLRPDTVRDWSAYLRSVVSDIDRKPDLARVRDDDRTRGFVERIRALGPAARDANLPTTDLVHGDFVLDNVLVRDGRAIAIDAEHAAKGTRAYDLATLWSEKRRRGRWPDPPTASARAIQAECVALVGLEGMRVCVAARLIGLLAFGLEHWPAADVPGAIASCDAVLDELSR